MKAKSNLKAWWGNVHPDTKFASSTVVLLLWGAFPIHVLGWIVSAIARHPEAARAIESEPAGRFLITWQGGMNFFIPVVLLTLMFGFLLGLQKFLQSRKVAEPEDGLVNMRVILHGVLIPGFFSMFAFASGVVVNGSSESLWASLLMMVIGAVELAFLYRFTGPHSEAEATIPKIKS